MGELRRIKTACAVLDAETGMLVAQYARTLSGIEQARARRGGGRGELADKEVDDLIAEALQDPATREAFRRAEAARKAQ